MSRLDAGAVEAAIAGYRALRELPADSPLAWTSAYRYPMSFKDGGRHVEHRFMQWAMVRRDSYYGEWSLYEVGVHVCSFATELLAEWSKADEDRREAEREKRDAMLKAREASNV